MPIRTFLAALVAGAILVTSALAAPPCGVVVLPTGLGVETSAEPLFSLHPLLTNNSIYDTEAFYQLYRPLLWIASDLTIDYEDSEARSIDVLDNNTLFRVHLKPWRWSDGAPVTADDVVYDFELIKQLGASYFGWGTDGMPDLFAAVTAIDPLTLEIRTPHPVNPEWFEELGIQTLFALPRHAWGKLDIEEQRARSGDPAFFSVVDGPFKVENYQVGRYLALSPNPQWSGRKPEMKRLVLDFLAGIDPLEALQSGEIDAATVAFNVKSKVGKLRDFRLLPLPPLSTYNGIIYNFANPASAFLRDLRVRQAIADAVDQKAIIDVIYRGSGEPVYGPVPSGDTTYLSPAAKAGRYAVGYDPEHARALLRAAGYTPGPDGVQQKDGARLEFTDLLSSNAPDRLLLGEFVQADLAKVGIRFNIRQLEFNQILALAYRQPLGWQTNSIGTTYPSYPDLGASFAIGAGQNFGRWADPATNTLLTQLANEPGRAALYAAQDRISEQQPQLFLPQGAYPILVAHGVEGYETALQTNLVWKLEYLHLTPGRACPARAVDTVEDDRHAPG